MKSGCKAIDGGLPMTNEVNTSRRRFLATSTAVVGAAGAVGVAVPFLGSWNPSAKAKAAGAPVKADLSKIKPGEMVTLPGAGSRFVDNYGHITETYPANPNGSPDGITALTTTDGRVTIMMPHPERASELALGNLDGKVMFESLLETAGILV